MTTLLTLTGFTPVQFGLVLAVVFVAGLVRGFAGFALSALVMASLASFIAPVELIGVCFLLELAATLLMVRGGFRDGNFGIALGLVIGSAIGAPVGLYLTNTLPVETSKMIALLLILGLALLQLLKVRATFLATKPGLYVSGFTAGVATGLASVGGMVVALYVLARERASREMRGSLVQFLAMSTMMSALYLVWYGMFTREVLMRGLVFALPCIAGVLLGQALFTPRFEGYYKPFCLCLLMLLAGAGLFRLVSGQA